MSVRILIGDCRERMAELDAGSVDSCVTDPPYHLTAKGTKRTNLTQPADKDLTKIKAGQFRRMAKGFMGQQWDGGDVAFQPETWAEVLRVLKPGAHLVAFSGTRTYHRMACAIEDAGFEIRDQLAWTYGSGFPKSHNQPGGWGTALKPAWEPICLARKPLVGTVAGNMAAHGTGAINIDGCRIASSDEDKAAINAKHAGMDPASYERPVGVSLNLSARPMPLQQAQAHDLGRWPANIIHDGSEEVLAAFPAETAVRGNKGESAARGAARDDVYAGGWGAKDCGERYNYDAGGSAARFFYCAKATTDERGEGNNHPTVKPIDLMRWLCRLVTPAGGTVLDPFAGSGSTLIAADAEQFNAIGCEMSPDYAAIAERRVRDAAGLFAQVQAA